ncbi:MAG: Asparagine synthetase 1 [Pseudomonadota bacterium]
MCGICGKLHLERDHAVEPRLVRHMMGLLEHRGPDGEGLYVAGPVGLGHRRLGIVDLAGGQQPMANEDGAIRLVYNGEIYNHAELRRGLLARGHRFRSTSDTEVIVHLYEELGDRCVEQLRGMFAFALWDAPRQRLLLARDRVGIKPLYYARAGRALVFASEIKALLADPEVVRQPGATGLDRFLAYYYTPGRETAFEGIHKLEPGHLLSVEDGRVGTPRRWWSLPFGTPDPAPSLADTAARLRELLASTVGQHMMADVPVGVLLSGGVDSSAVLHYASQHAGRHGGVPAGGPLHSYTIGFGGDHVVDERPWARLAARANASVHHEATLTPGEFRDALARHVWHMEEPVCEPPAIALWRVAALARQTGVKVLLSGEGGDEAFAGYPEYRNLQALEGLKSALGGAAGLLGAGLRLLRSAGWARGQHYADLVGRDVSDYYRSRTATPGTAFDRLRLARGSTADAPGAARCDEPSRELLLRTRGQPLLDRLLQVDTCTWLPDDLLLKADRMSMAASVELRVPLLDHELLEFAAALPPAHKLHGWSLKHVLRLALAGVVPTPILQRRKAGFPVPYARWLRHELRDHVHDTLLAGNGYCTGLFPRRLVVQLLADQQAGLPVAKEVFGLLVLELWHERFFRGTAGSALRAGPVRPAAAAAPAPAGMPACGVQEPA